MKKNKRFFILGPILLCLFVQMTFSGNPRDAAPNDLRIERLAGLGRLWGAVKFCHPFLAYKNMDWDAALIKTLPLVRAAKSAEDYRQAISGLLAGLGDPATSIEPPGPEKPNIRPPQNPTTNPEKRQPFVDKTDDGIAVVTANDYRQFADDTADFATLYAAFQKAFSEAASSVRVLIDLRNLNGPDSHLLEMTVSRFLPVLLRRDAVLPPLRFLSHEGYPSQRESTYAYHSDLTVRSGGILRASLPMTPRPEKIVFVLNGASCPIHRYLAALQDAGLAFVVQEGKLAPALGIPVMTVELPDSLRVRLRTAEILRTNGGIDFEPDLVVRTGGREAGLDVLRGKSAVEKRSGAGSGDGSIRNFSVAEKSYPEMVYPDQDFRLLALFRFWNITNDFYPYKDLMDQPWDKTLVEFIPKMEAAKDALEYVLTVAELVARIQDSHGTITSPLYTQYFGTHGPGVAVGFIESRPVITMIKDASAREKGLAVGDVVLAVDGEESGARRARMKRYLPASTAGRLEARVDMLFLAGNKDVPVKLRVQKGSGEIVDVELARTLSAGASRPEYTALPNMAVLPSGFGYIDLGRIVDADVGPALEKIKSTPGLILDMRGYPIGGTWLLFSRLAKEKKPFARLQFPQYSGEGGSFTSREEFQYLNPAEEHFAYKGKIAVLIHGSTQSAAEHTCLGLETAADVTFIGSPSSGADGNITYTFLPGAVAVSFTGMGVSHADGRQLQRKGIQPHVGAAPTIAGIRAGRDECLEKAVEFLTANPAGKKPGNQ